jgi:hypothetical protein
MLRLSDGTQSVELGPEEGAGVALEARLLHKTRRLQSELTAAKVLALYRALT